MSLLPIKLSIENRKLCLGYLGNKVRSWKEDNKNFFDLSDVKGDISMMMYNLGLNHIVYKKNILVSKIKKQPKNCRRN